MIKSENILNNIDIVEISNYNYNEKISKNLIEWAKKNKDKVKKVASPMTFSKMTSPKMVCETSPKIHTRATSPKPNGSSWMSKF